MSFRIMHGDVLHAEADALLLTLDGSKRGLEGNIARAFAKRFPDDWESIEGAVPFPIALGRIVFVRNDGDAPWHSFIIAATLHHVDIIDDGAKLDIIRRAFREALLLCGRHAIFSLATTVLAGGWRIDAARAFSTMKLEYQRTSATSKPLDVLICVTDEQLARKLCGIPSECALSISEYYLVTDMAHKAICDGVTSFTTGGCQFEVRVGCQTDVPMNGSFVCETVVIVKYVLYEVT